LRFAASTAPIGCQVALPGALKNIFLRRRFDQADETIVNFVSIWALRSQSGGPVDRRIRATLPATDRPKPVNPDRAKWLGPGIARAAVVKSDPAPHSRNVLATGALASPSKPVGEMIARLSSAGQTSSEAPRQIDVNHRKYRVNRFEIPEAK
jgi:hypothetical protein